MKYKVSIESSVLKVLKKIPLKDYKRISKAIDSLENNPRPKSTKKLKDREAWRIRVGDYRIIYEIKDKICHIIVININHRKDVYRDF